jgi:transglutaminase-like putative cysteine protease
MVATAFAALVLTGTLDWPSAMLYCLALGASFYIDARNLDALRPRAWVWRAVTVGYIAFALLDATVISSKTVALVHLTLFVSAVKLLQNKRNRDWVFLYLIAFFQMLLAAGLTFDTTFIGSLIAFLFFFISTLAAFEIRRARSEVKLVEEEIITPSKEARKSRYRVKAKADGSRPVGRVRYLVGASVAQVLMVIVLTLPLFFMIPRLGGGGVAGGYGESYPLTGFSEIVQLGDVASIKEDSRVVMRVQLSATPARFIRWRGIALDFYDGRKWRNTNSPYTGSQNRYVPNSSAEEDDRFDRRYALAPASRRPIDRSKLFEQKIYLDSINMINSMTLFGAHRMVQLQGPLPKLNIRGTGHEGLEDITSVSVDGLRGRTSYTVWSDLSVPNDQELRAGFMTDRPVNPAYLQTPDKSDEVALDPRIEELAREVARNAPTPYDKARAIEAYLKSFRYSLDLKPARYDPLAEFLFETREGHCEYFATAMTVMLRTLGIPARIVNGFQMGEYNDVNGLYTVRARDAHSWVEAYFPRTDSWVEFDPTPSAGINDYSQGGLLAGLRKYLEAAEVFWLDYIVTLDGDEQASIMVELQQRLRAVKDRLVDTYLSVKQWVAGEVNRLLVERRWRETDALRLAGVIGLVMVAALALYVAASFLKRRRLAPTGYGPWWHRLFILPSWRSARLRGRNHRASAVLFYEQMLAIAARRGMIKQPDQTPREFADATGLSQIREITTVYNRVRFGGAQLDEAEARRVSGLLSDLRRTLSGKVTKVTAATLFNRLLKRRLKA